MRLSLFIIACLLPSFVQGSDFTADIAVEARYFPQTSHNPGHQSDVSLHLATQWQAEVPTLNAHATFELNAALDQQDSARSLVDVSEANLRWQYEAWEISAGIGTVFWGVVESQHLVDIVNQRNWAENLDGEDKLGQTMLNVRTFQAWGELSVFILPGFRERLFPSGDARPGFGASIEQSRYESSAQAWHTDIALRYSRQLDSWDVGLSWFSGTSREPRIARDTGTQLIAYYEQIQQFGVDLQSTQGAWLFKFEGVLRRGQGEDFYALVGGIEYSLFSVGGGDSDIGLILEYSRDDRDVLQQDAAFAQPLVALRLFKGAFFAGVRVGLNDIEDSTLLLGCASDQYSAAYFCNLEGSRRIGDDLQLSVEARMFAHLPSDNAFAQVARDDSIALRLRWYF